ncbi:44252_t:CDS:2, partial [Gigaspora margarita]
FSADKILSENQNENMTELYGSYGYNHDLASFGSVATGYCILFCAIIFFSICCKDDDDCNIICGFMLNIPGAIFSIPLAYPYLKDQIIGPDYRIIQCDQIDSLGSWQDQWSIALLIVLVVLCKRSYRISKLWVVYQYQYKKGLFLTWLKEQKEKSRQQQIEPVTAKNVKSDMVNKEINIVEVVTIG